MDELAKGFKEGPTSWETQTGEKSMSEVRLALSYIRVILDLWWEKHNYLFAKSKTIHGYTIFDFDVAEEPVSIHLLLHRTLASFLEVYTSAWGMDLNDALQLLEIKSSKIVNSFPELLLEEPLRVQVFMAQVWTRSRKINPKRYKPECGSGMDRACSV